MSQRPDKASPRIDDGLRTIEDIVACCVALGAPKSGGPLSVAESQQIALSEGVRPEDLQAEELRSRIVAGQDPLGTALSKLRSPISKRSAGAIYTPPEIVSAMVSWVLGRQPATVVDAGCGSGRFALDAARRAAKPLTVVAIDNDPVATLICRAGFAALAMPGQRVINADFLTCGILRDEGRAAFIGNPPYLRHHGLTPTQKEWGREAATRLSLPRSGLAGLHVLFLLATALKMRPGDVGCFITSAEWLDVGYGRTLRAMLAHNPRLQAIRLLDPRACAFSDAITTSAILCLEAGGTNERVTARAMQRVEELVDLQDVGHTISIETLASSPRWTRLLADGTSEAPHQDGLVPLGSLVRVSRGVATGANRYFVLRKPELLARGLADFGTPVVSSAEEVFEARGEIRARAKTRYLLDVPETLGEAAWEHPALCRFLAEGVALGVPDAYLCRQRRAWWVLKPTRPAVVAT